MLASKGVSKDRDNPCCGPVRERMSSAATACESGRMHRRQGYQPIKTTGGRIPVLTVANLGRYLGYKKGLRIANLQLGSARVRAITRDVGCSASTISRELRPNSNSTRRTYRPYAAQKRCVMRASGPSAASSTTGCLPL